MKILIVIASVLISSYCEDCEVCPPMPKIYDELGCVGKLDDKGCCFERLDIGVIFLFFQ